MIKASLFLQRRLRTNLKTSNRWRQGRRNILNHALSFILVFFLKWCGNIADGWWLILLPALSFRRYLLLSYDESYKWLLPFHELFLL